jgi:spore cortex biosynthesis protein YabQ
MTLSTQFLTMLVMIGMGAFFGAALDTYNRFLQRSKRKNWFTFINDVLFWVFQGLLIFYVLFHVNQGEWRFYIFIALICGFAAYQSLFKQIYLKILEILINVVISIYNFFVRLFLALIYKPIKGLVTLLISTIMILSNGLYMVIKWVIRSIWLIIRQIIKLMMWFLLLFWKLFPKPLKNSVEKLYNRIAGNLKSIKNSIIKLISKWKKDQ